MDRQSGLYRDSGEDIVRLAENEGLINPCPDTEESGQYQPASFDLKVGTVIVPGEGKTGRHTLDPGDIATVLTEEELNMPVDMAATVFPINNFSSQGLLVLNPGHIDPDYRGVVSIKLINLTENKEVIHQGMDIFTCLFESLARVAPEYPGEYYTPDERGDRLQKDDERSAPSALVEVQGEGVEDIAKRVYDRNKKSEWEWQAFLVLLGALLGYFLDNVYAIIQQLSSSGE